MFGNRKMRYLIINTKNYLEASGKKLDQLLKSSVELARTRKDVRTFIAVPAFDLRYLHDKFPNANLFVQHLDNSQLGSSTGYLVPDTAKLCGAVGSIVNHSEHRIPKESIEELVTRLRSLKLLSVVCARNEAEVSEYAKFGPDFVAVEPPELIGTGKAVSKASPAIITRSRDALLKSKSKESRTRLLCGAGIVTGDDAKTAVKLGSEGILIASGVVLASNRPNKIKELLQGLSPE